MHNCDLTFSNLNIRNEWHCLKVHKDMIFVGNRYVINSTEKPFGLHMIWLVHI